MDRQTIAAALLHDVVEDTSHHQRTSRRAVRRGDRAPGRRRHQADAHSVSIEGRRAGREPAQDVHGDGQGHSRHHHQARRPAAQHAHAGEPAAGKAVRDRARNARHLRADRPSAGHLEDQVGNRRRVSALSRSGGVSRDRRTRRQDATRTRRRRPRRRSKACATSSKR